MLRPGHSIAGLAAYHVEVDICDPRKPGSPKKPKVPEERVETQMKESTKKARKPTSRPTEVGQPESVNAQGKEDPTLTCYGRSLEHRQGVRDK